MRWAEGGSCRHNAVLRYFGSDETLPGGCGRCDVCTSLAKEDAGVAPDEAQLIVRKALSAVARVHGRFGLGLAARLAAGRPDRRLGESRLDRVTTFGVLAAHREEWVVRLLRRCVTAGWVSFTGEERPRVLLTREGHLVMKGEVPARLLLPADGNETRARPETRTAVPAPGDDETAGPELELFEALRAHRVEVAKRERVPPYVIASDRTLRELARKRPLDEASLLLVHGIGPGKAARYGDGLLAVIRNRA
jgi:ATP-dependent DNA helicase RecQ